MQHRNIKERIETIDKKDPDLIHTKIVREEFEGSLRLKDGKCPNWTTDRENQCEDAHHPTELNLKGVKNNLGRIDLMQKRQMDALKASKPLEPWRPSKPGMIEDRKFAI